MILSFFLLVVFCFVGFIFCDESGAGSGAGEAEMATEAAPVLEDEIAEDPLQGPSIWTLSYRRFKYLLK